MSSISSDSNKNLFFSTLSGAEKVLYNAERKFYLDNGYSVVEAEENAWRKIQNVKKLVKNKSILRY